MHYFITKKNNELTWFDFSWCFFMQVLLSMYGCQSSSQHIVVLEKDEGILKALLALLMFAIQSIIVVPEPMVEELIDPNKELCAMEHHGKITIQYVNQPSSFLSKLNLYCT